MGSWNATCALSGMSYEWEPGMKVGLVFLKQRTPSHGRQTVHIHERFEMLTPPLWGRYDTYGKVEVDDSSWAQAALKLLKSICPDVQDLMHAQEIIFDDNRGALDGIFFTMVRKDVWDAMVKQGEAVTERDRRPNRTRDADIPLRTLALHPESQLISYLNGYNYDFTMPSPLYPKDKEVPVPYDDSKTTMNEEERNFFMDVYFVQSLMSNLRMEWSVGTGAGSQHDNHDDRKTWFMLMASICDQTKANKESM